LTKSLRSSAERRRPILPLLLLLVLAAGGVVPALVGAARSLAVSPAVLRDRARQVLADPRYQRAMPARAAGGDRTGPPLDLPFERLPRFALPVLGLGATVGQLVFFALAAAALVAISVWVASTIQRRRTRAAPAAGAADGQEAGDRPWEPSADDAARLAAAGRYGEAVHALLLAAIRQLGARGRRAVQPHQTSRELARALPLAPDSRLAFQELVAAVERSLFGGAPIELEEYESCRRRYLRLLGGSAG
jgi:hypothetical protein